MATRLDVIIFGASGFTGKYTILEAVKLLSGMTWGVAGRNKEKLEAVLKEMGGKSEKDLSHIPIVIADVKDDESLKKMAEQAKIIVNCCGPYRFYGEPVIKACIEAGTHHVDVSGEPQFMERMQLEYHEKAKEKGVYIISACGFDSIPCDMGVVFLESKFDGVVNSVESYLELEDKSGIGGPSIHYGTWESAVYGLAHAGELKDLRRKLYKERLPAMLPKLKNRSMVHQNPTLPNNYFLPFPGSDRSIVQRTQRYFYDNDKKRPIQIHAYFGLQNIFQVISIFIVGAIFTLLTKFQFGQKLLLDYPQIFSFGSVTHDEINEEKMNKTAFKFTFIGEGWSKDQQLAESTDQHSEPPNKTIMTRVTGTNPGYGATCVSLLVSAKTVILETDKIPGKGGVLTTGVAFSKTNIISELCKSGFTFDVVKS